MDKQRGQTFPAEEGSVLVQSLVCLHQNERVPPPLRPIIGHPQERFGFRCIRGHRPAKNVVMGALKDVLYIFRQLLLRFTRPTAQETDAPLDWYFLIFQYLFILTVFLLSFSFALSFLDLRDFLLLYIFFCISLCRVLHSCRSRFSLLGWPLVGYVVTTAVNPQGRSSLFKLPFWRRNEVQKYKFLIIEWWGHIISY